MGDSSRFESQSGAMSLGRGVFGGVGLALLAFLALSGCGEADGDSNKTGSGGGRSDASAGSGGAGATGGSSGAGGAGGSAGTGTSGSGGEGGGAGAAGGGSELLGPCYSADDSCPPGSRCIEACYNMLNGGPGGVCSVPGRDGCGCGAVFDPCDDSGLQCLMPACCEAEGVCVTPEERADICAGPAAYRFDCEGTMSSTSHLVCNLFTGVERYAIYQRDDIRNLCLEIVVVVGGPGGGPLTISVDDSWAASSISITNRAADCVPHFVSQPMGVRVAATGGTGTITMHASDGGFLYPFVSADVTATFPAADSWVPPSASVSLSLFPTELPGCMPPGGG